MKTHIMNSKKFCPPNQDWLAFPQTRQSVEARRSRRFNFHIAPAGEPFPPPEQSAAPDQSASSLPKPDSEFWGAHASRAPATASRRQSRHSSFGHLSLKDGITKFAAGRRKPRARGVCSSLPGREIAAARRWLKTALLAYVLTAAGWLPAADTYSIDWYKIAGGGGVSSNGQYTVSGTIGQADASVAPMNGGSYSLTGGFWALISVAQTPGAPTLYISRAGNTVTVYWQAVAGWSLQQNGNLANLSGWAVSGYSVTTSNGTNSVTITPPTGNLYFRLSGP